MQTPWLRQSVNYGPSFVWQAHLSQYVPDSSHPALHRHSWPCSKRSRAAPLSGPTAPSGSVRSRFGEEGEQQSTDPSLGMAKLRCEVSRRSIESDEPRSLHEGVSVLVDGSEGGSPMIDCTLPASAFDCVMWGIMLAGTFDAVRRS
jgi:hypothetical protein